MTPTPSLTARYAELKAAETRLRARDAAARLGVSEAELLASGALGDVVHLTPDFPAILVDLGAVGTVMALTRNDHAVIECDGDYRTFEKKGPHGLTLDADGVDLRIFFRAWAYGFAAVTTSGNRTLRSLQFFDSHGVAVHKVYLRAEGDREQWDALIARHRSEPRAVVAVPRPAPAVPTPDADLDVAAFQAGWLALQDTHDFFGLLRKHGVQRAQSMRLAPAGHAERLSLETPDVLLEGARDRQVPMMTFAGSTGCVQIRTAKPQTVKRLGPWLNILDPGFNLHLKTEGVAAVWLVRKPTVDGIVTSVEMYDSAGDLVVQFFGDRKEGVAERDDWRGLLADLPRLEAGDA